MQSTTFLNGEGVENNLSALNQSIYVDDYLQEITNFKELEVNYEKLLQERDNRITASVIHKKLTDEVLKGSNLEAITQEVYKLTKIPIAIFTFGGEPIAKAGFSSLPFTITSKEFKQFMKMEENRNPFNQPILAKYHSYKSYSFLSSPIYIHENLSGYCLFIISKSEGNKKDLLNIIIEKVASVCSLCLFFEKTKLESFERMKGTFFDEILSGNFTSSLEIIAKASLIHLDLTVPYRIVIIEHSVSSTNNPNKLVLLKELMEVISHYCNQQKQDMLMGHNSGRIILLFTKKQVERNDEDSFVGELYQFLMEKFTNYDFYFGVSKRTISIKDAANAYNEASIASRIVSKKNRIVSFDQLGLVGVLVNQNNEAEVREMAHTYLGKLLMNGSTSVDMIKTLYSFLLNGGNLEKTADELSLSISGLRYRISKIEELLQKDIRNPSTSYQLLLSIQALNIIGDLDFKTWAI